MCDCFHLAFPNWHGSPGTGAGRRLKGPEPEDDSVCDDPPEFLEGERPRPQGSSPVNDYPATEKYTDLDKEREEEIYDPYQKSSASKKGKKIGFGSFFEKRSKMSQEESPESGVIVKTAKEVCAEGLVVSGGGKEGIFIKEVKAESPAAKHLSVQEGDQILSATVYFDNVSYEDALQILEHAQPYKMELCLKRKPLAASDLESATAERQEVAPGEEGDNPLERGRAKTQRRQDARISWPKFPSFSRGRKAHFKRSHSTSEAEEQRKLEMSPTTSDTESPMKSQESGKDKKTKKQKMKLSKLKMKGIKSKSVEQQYEDSTVPVSRSLENVQPQLTEHDLDTHSPLPQKGILGEAPQIPMMDQQEKKETTKTRNECNFPDVSGSVPETSQHRTELISLDKTLKTTDISDFLADQRIPSTKKSPDVKKKKKKERSELKVNIQGKEKDDFSPAGLLKSPQTLVIKTSSDNLKTPDMGARTQDLLGNTVGPNVISHTELKGSPIAIDINTDRIDPNKSIPKVDKESSAEKAISTTAMIGDVDICLPKVDMSLDMSDVGLLKKSPKIKSGKTKRERSILIHDSERYGIRPRGPMADISMTKKHLGKSNLLDSDSDIKKPKSPKMKTSLPSVKGQEITANRKDASVMMETVVDMQSPQLEIQASKSPKERNINNVTEKTEIKTVPKFKMPKIDVPDFSVHEPILKTEVGASKVKGDVKVPKVQDRMHDSKKTSPTKQVIKIELLKREDIEIPGMEATALAGNLHISGFKSPETGKLDASVPTAETHAKKIQADMKFDGIKDTISKTDLQTFKLPKLDITGLDVHQEITKSEATAEKAKTPEMGVKGQDLKIQASDHSTEIGINFINGEMIKRTIPTHKIDISDPDAHEPISMAQVSSPKTEVEIYGSKIEGKLSMAAVDGRTREISSSHSEMDKTKKPELKLPKREDIEIPGMESTSAAGNILTVDIQLPVIGKEDASDPSVEVQAKQIQPQSNAENIKEAISNVSHPAFKLPKIDSDFDVHKQITKRDVNTEKSKSPKQRGKDHAEGTKGKFKIPPVQEYDGSFPNLKSDVKLTKELGEERETGENKCTSDTEMHIATRKDMNADFKSPSTEMSQNKEIKVEVQLGATVTDTKVSIKKPKKSKVSMPTHGITKPDIIFPEAGVQISLPKGKASGIESENISADMSLSPVKMSKLEEPDLDIIGPNITVTHRDIEIKEPKVVMKGPSPEDKLGISLKETKDTLHMEIPSVDISKPDIKAPQLARGITLPSLSRYEISTAENKATEIDVSLPKGDYSLPRGVVDMKGTDGDIKIPETTAKINFAGSPTKLKLPASKMPQLGIKSPKVTESIPDVTAVVTMPEFEAQPGKIGVEVPEIDIKKQPIETDKSKDKTELPELQMPDINDELPKIKSTKIIIKSTQTKTKIQISKPEIDIKNPNVGIISPSLEINTGILETGESNGKFQMPHTKMPSFRREAPTTDQCIEFGAAEVNVEMKGGNFEKEGQENRFKVPKFDTLLPKVKGPAVDIDTLENVDIPRPEVETEVVLPAVEFEGPSIEGKAEISDIDANGFGVKIKKPKISLPKFGFSKPDIKDHGTDASFLHGDSLAKKITVDVKGPEVDIEASKTQAEIECKHMDTGGSPATFKLPQVKLPTFGTSVTKTKTDATDINSDISVPEVKTPSFKVGLDTGVSDIHVDRNIELDKQTGKTELLEMKQPDIDVSLPKVKDQGVTLKKQFESDVSVPIATENPSLDVTAKIPDVESGGQVKFEIPHLKIPSFGIPKLELKGPEAPGDIGLTSTKIDLKKQDADVKGQVSIDGTSTDIDEGALSGKIPEAAVKSPKISAEPAVHTDIEGRDAELGQGSKFKPPKFGISLPKVEVPGMDISTSMPDVSISLPEVTVKGQLPGAETEGLAVEGTKPDVIKPDVKAPEMEAYIPEESISVPEMVDLTGPEVERSSMEANVDTDTGAPTSKFKMPTFTLPKIGVTVPTVKAHFPEARAEITQPEIKAPSVEVDIGHDHEHKIEKQEGKFELPKMKIPKIDLTLSKSKIHQEIPKAEAELSFPETDIVTKESSVEGPSLGKQAEIPDIETVQHEQFKMPHIKLPSFGFSKPEITGPKISGDVHLPSVNIAITKPSADISAQGISADVTSSGMKLQETPEVDIKDKNVDFEGPDINVNMKGKGVEHEEQGSKFKLPKFGIPFPKVKGPAVDISASKPDVDISLPQAKIEAQVPDVEMEELSVEGNVELPEFDGKAADITVKKPKISLPKFGFSRPDVKGPEIDNSLQKGDITLAGGIMEVTEPDIDITAPDLSEKEDSDIRGSPSKFKVPSLKLPRFGITAPKVKAEVPDLSVNIAVPETETPSGKAIDNDGIVMETGKVEGKFELPKVKIPSIDVKVPTLKGPDMSQEIPKAECEISVPDIALHMSKADLKGSSIDGQAEIPETEAGAGEQGRFKMPHIKLPSFGFSKPEMTAPKVSGNINLPSVDIAVTKPNADISVPEISADVTSAGVQLPKTDLALSGEGPAVEAPGVGIDIKGKGAELEGQGSKFKLPKFGISMPKAKGPAVDINVSKSDVDITLPEVTAEAKLPGIEVEGPSVEGRVDTPEVDSKEFDVKFKKPKISFPKLGFSKPEITAPEIDINLPKGDISLTGGHVKVKEPEINIKAADTGDKQDSDIKGSPSKFKVPTFNLPKFGITAPKVKAEAPDLNVNITVPETETPSGKVIIDQKATVMEIGKAESKFELPKMKIPSIDVKVPTLKGPDMSQEIPKAECEISVPDTDIALHMPKVDLKGSSIDGQAEIPDIEAGAGEQGRFKMPHIKLPSFGFSKPEMTAPKVSGNINLPSVDIAVTKPNADISVPEISADVTSAGVQLPKTDLALSGEGPAVEAPGVGIDIKGKGAELEGQGSKFKLPKFGISMPKAKGPAVDINVSKPDVDITLPEVTAEAKLPGIEVEGPSVEGRVDIPEVDSKEFDVKFKKPKISFPKLGFSKPEITAPEIDINLPKGDISLTGGHVKVKEPEINIKAAETGDKQDSDIKGSPSKFKVPTFNLPKFGITAPKVKAEAPDLNVNINVPETETPSGKAIIDQKGTVLEIEKADGKFELPKMKIPSIDVKVPNLKGPDMSQEIPKAECEISEPDTDIALHMPKVDLKGSSIDGQAEIPDIEAGAGEQGRFKMPHIKLPSFGFSKPEITTPKISGNLNLPSVDIAVTKPNADFKVPEISADVTSAGVKLPEAELALVGEAHAVEAPGVDIDIKGKGAELEGQGSKFKLPKFGISMPKAKGPAVDIDVSKPDVDITLPEVTAEAKLPGIEVEGPSVEGRVDIPEVDSKEFDVKFKKPKISFPKLGFSKPEITAPEIDINLPKGDISLTGGHVKVKEPEINIKAADTGDKQDSDIKGSPSKFKVPTFNLPKFGITAPKVKAEAPDLNVNITVPETETPSGKVIIDQKATVMEIGKAESKFELPKMKIPSIDVKVPTLKGPDMSQEIPKAECEISVPDTDIALHMPKVDLKGSSIDGQAEIPDIEAGAGEQGRFKMPHIKLPSFGFSKPEMTAPKVSGNINLPSVDIAVTKPNADISVPEISADVTSAGVQLPKTDLALSGEGPAVEAPGVGIDIKGKGAELEGQGSKFKLPKFGISMPKAKGPAVDINVSKPDVDITLPEVTAEAKLPGIEVEGPSVEGRVDIPEVDSKEFDVKFKKPKISFPKFGFSKPEITAPKISGNLNLPSVDIAVTKPNADIKVPEISADVTSAGVKLPEADLALSGEAPAVDIKGYSMDVEVPDVDIDKKVKGTELEGQGGKFKLPKFGISFPKAKGPEMDISMSKPDVDITLPEVAAEAKLPGVEIEGPSVEGTIDMPEVDSKELDVKLKKPKVSFPKFGFSKPEITAPEIDINLPKGDISLTGGHVKVKEPEINIKAADTGDKQDSDIKGSPSKFKVPTFNLPKFGITAPKVKAEAPDLNVNITVPETETPSGEVIIDQKGTVMEIGKAESKFELPKMKIPSIDVKVPTLKGPDMSQEIPKAECEISVPDTDIALHMPKVDLKGSSIDGQAEIPDIGAGAGEQGRFKMPHIKLPSFGFSKPEITTPKISGNLNLPSVDIAVTKPNADIKVPELSADVTSAGVKLPEAELALSGEPQAVEVPGVDIDVKGKGAELEGQGSKFKLPKFGISFPKAKGPAMDISVSKPDVDITLPEVAAEAKLPGVEIEGPSVEGTIDMPEVDSKELDVKLKKPKMSFPKFGFSKPEITAPEIGISLPKGDISLTGGHVEVKEPEINIKAADIGDKQESDIKGSPSKFKVPTFKLPKFGITTPKVKAEAPDLSVSITVPETETLSGKAVIDNDGTVMDTGKAESKFELPKMKIPSIDVKVPTLKGPDMSQEIPKAECEISVPDTDIALHMPKVDLEGSSIDGRAEIPDIEAGAGEQGRFKMPHIKLPSFGFSKPEITTPKISGNLNLPSVDIAVTKPNADIKVPEISADVTSAGVKLPEAELALSGEPHAVEAPEVDIDIKGKGTELEGQGSKFKLPKFGISFPKAKGPAVDISVSKPDVDITLPEVAAEAKLPGVEIEGPSVEGTIDMPEVDSKELDVKLKKPKMSFPKFGFSKPEITTPEIDINFPKGDISLTGGHVEVKDPEINIKAADIGDKQESDIKGSPSKFKVPTFKLPKFGITAPKVKAEAPDLSVNIAVPETETPSGKATIDNDRTVMETGEAEGKFELPKMKIPSIDVNVPTLKRPGMSQEIPKAECEISVPDTDIALHMPTVDLKASSLDGRAEIPDIEAGAGEQGRFKMPHIKLPSFGFSKPEITAPKISGNLNLPSVDITVTKPNADVKVPEISADVTSAGVKLPEAELALSGEAPAVEAPGVDIDIKGKGAELEGQGSKFKLPKFGISFPKAKGPAVDINVSKPDVDITLPEVTAEAKLPGIEIEGPSVEGTVDTPDLHSKEVDVKVKKPKISFPKFGFSKPDIKAPEIDINLPKHDISLPEASIEVKRPEVDIKASDIPTDIKDKDMDIVVSPTKFKLPTIKFPKFEISAPKITTESPDLKTDIKSLEIETSEKGKVDIEAPSIDIDGSSVELNKPEGQIELSKIKMPNIDVSLTKAKGYIKTPDIDMNLPEVDMSLPEANVEVKGSVVATKTQDSEANVDINIGGSPSKFKLPTFKLPKFGITGSKVKAEIPEVSVESTGPEIESLSGKVNVEHAGQGMDTEKSKVKIELPKVKMPDISFSLPKAKGIEIHQEIPEAESNISVPETDIVLKEPKLELKGMHIDGQAEIPGIETGAGEQGKLKMPHVKMPSFGFSRPEITGPKISADVNLPSFDIGVAKPDTEINVPQVRMSGVEVERPFVEGTVDVPDLDSKGLDAKVKKAKISFPKFGFSKPDVKALEPEVSLPKGDISLTGGNIEVKGPEVDITTPETQIEIKDKDMDIVGSPTKFKLPTIKFPKFGISAPKVTAEPSNAKIDITVPELETSSKQLKVDVGAPEPELAMSGGVNINIDSPSFNADGKGAESEGQGSRFKLPKFGISFQKAKGPGVDISESKPEVDISSPQVTVEGQLPSVEIEGPSVEGRVDEPELDSKDVELKVKKPSFHFPKFGFSKPDVKAPEIHVNLPKGDISLTEGSMEVKEPEVDIQAPETQIEIKDKDMDIVGSPTKFKLPTFKFPKFGTVSPKSKVETHEVSAEITTPEMKAQLEKTDVGDPDLETDVLQIEIEKSESTVKLPKLKMTRIDMSLPKGQGLESKPEDETPAVKVKTDVSELEATGTALEAKVDTSDPMPPKPEAENKGSPSKFKLPTFKMPKFGFSSAKAKTSDTDVDTGLKIPEVPFESKTKETEESVDDGTANVTDTDKKAGDDEGKPKSSKLSLSSIGNVFKGFDLEFNVPTLEEVEESLASPREDVAQSGKNEQSTHTSAENDSIIKHQSQTDPSQIQLSTSHHGAEVSIQTPTVTKEAEAKEQSKFKFRFPRLGFTESSEQDDKAESINVSVKETEKLLEPREEKENEDIKEKEANSDKGSWFKFPKFGITSPSKTTKGSEKDTGQPSKSINKSIEGDIEEEDVSLTASVRSSDAFADISSTVISEQPEPLVVSPTKVKVKISEPTAMVGVSEVKVPTDIITSTARTELILLEHHLPEKVDTVTIPVSSEATLTSPDELTQETGDIHVVTSNIQATPSSEHAKVITKYETRSVQALSQQKMTVKVKVSSTSGTAEGSGEGPGESSEQSILVEKHMVKEKSGDDKGAVIITQRVTQIVGANSGEPILEDTASAIKKLRDTMHSEKMKFFEDAETSTVTVSSHKIEKHVLETSTEKKYV